MSSSRPTTPSTPTRPPKSERRLTFESIASLPLPMEASAPPPLPSSPASASASEASRDPVTPKTPTAPSRPDLANRKSISSIKRKPVPSTPDDQSFELQAAIGSRASHTIDSQNSLADPRNYENQPPRYIMPVDLPPAARAHQQPEARLPPGVVDFTASRPPSYANDHSYHLHSIGPGPVRPDELYSTPTAGHVATGSSYTLPSSDELPCYAEKTQTEPKTLARALWKWGWCCPLLWFIGMCIIWIPLKPVEEEADPEKAQKLDEMIIILREAELKYAKRCAYSFSGFLLLIAIIVTIAVVLSKLL
ncbi:uncharacterized protein I206_106643 [Kwoniella pini CBS 10737]|uniref:Uncharacterized protein n=1 Tax=Kwoniella pini CBS 10737 TaxID=1296096 RepID=A0A1B9HTL7_9TREE|nr:uncharacterized protein I206_07466 [Kwoniella pini CBS 10737]OCF46613.1 hypothetical protein I206_07466 [Kwoniella pini CBS 10737]